MSITQLVRDSSDFFDHSVICSYSGLRQVTQKCTSGILAAGLFFTGQMPFRSPADSIKIKKNAKCHISLSRLAISFHCNGDTGHHINWAHTPI